MGKLTPDLDTTALISRYVTAPLLSLDDIGRYALTLAGLPVAETAALASTPGLLAKTKAGNLSF